MEPQINLWDLKTITRREYSKVTSPCREERSGVLNKECSLLREQNQSNLRIHRTSWVLMGFLSPVVVQNRALVQPPDRVEEKINIQWTSTKTLVMMRVLGKSIIVLDAVVSHRTNKWPHTKNVSQIKGGLIEGREVIKNDFEWRIYVLPGGLIMLRNCA